MINRRHEYLNKIVRHQRLAALLSIIVLLFGVSEFENDSLFSYENKRADETCIIAVSSSTSDVISDENTGISLLRGASLQKSTYRGFGFRDFSICFKSIGFSLTLLFFYYLYGYLKTVIFSRLIIIKYIHDLDGLKS